MKGKDFDVGYSFIAHIGFAVMGTESEIEAFLTEIYKETPKSITHAQLFSHINSQFTTKKFSTKEFGEFSSVFTTLRASTSRIIDVVTIAVLSSEQIRSIQEGSSDINDLHGLINETFNNSEIYFNISTQEVNEQYPIITYISPSEYHVVVNEDEKIELEECCKWILDNDLLLNRFTFNTHQLPTLLRGSKFQGTDLFVSSRYSSISGPFAILSAAQFHRFYRDVEEGADMSIDSEIYEDLSILISLMRSFSWLEYRLVEIDELDKLTYSILGADLNHKKFKKILSKYMEYEKARVKWIEISNRLYDEIEGLKKMVPPINFDTENYKIGMYDFPLNLPFGTRLIGKPNSIVFLQLDTIETYYKETLKRIEVINKKMENLSTFFNSALSILSIKHTRFHTIIMTLMTIIILGATVAMLIE